MRFWCDRHAVVKRASFIYTHGMKAGSMTILLFRYVFHTLVFTVYVWRGIITRHCHYVWRVDNNQGIATMCGEWIITRALPLCVESGAQVKGKIGTHQGLNR